MTEVAFRRRLGWTWLSYVIVGSMTSLLLRFASLELIIQLCAYLAVYVGFLLYVILLFRAARVTDLRNQQGLLMPRPPGRFAVFNARVLLVAMQFGLLTGVWQVRNLPGWAGAFGLGVGLAANFGFTWTSFRLIRDRGIRPRVEESLS